MFPVNLNSLSVKLGATQVRVCLSLALLAACAPEPPADGGPACEGGLSFSRCSRATGQPGPDAPSICSAQIGFEDGSAAGFWVPPRPAGALFDVTISGERVRCGSRALRVSAGFDGRESAQGFIEGPLVGLPASASVLTFWIFFDGPAFPSEARGFALVMPFARIETQPIPLVEGQWILVTIPLQFLEPQPGAIESRLIVNLTIPSRPWMGYVYLDEVGWRVPR
jgi:hypothetical protein